MFPFFSNGEPVVRKTVHHRHTHAHTNPRTVEYVNPPGMYMYHEVLELHQYLLKKIGYVNRDI